MPLSSPLASDYVSPPSHPAWWTRAFPSLAFYRRLAGIVWSAGKIAKRGAYTDEQWIASSLATARAVEAVGGRITIENTAAIAGLTGPAVIVGNHMSTLETFLLACVVYPHRPLTFVVKRELFATPMFKYVMIARQPIVVGRENARDDLRIMLEEGEARLRAGVSVAVFPQRTRAAVWKPEEFNSIATKLARRAGVPVVPLAVRTDLWSIGRLVKDCGPIHPERPVRLAFGAPIDVTGNGREAQAAVVDFITSRMEAWGVPVIATDEATAAT